MTTPEEYEKSRKRHAWKVVQQLDVLHSELASLYRLPNVDPRQIAAIWSAIEMHEEDLNRMGIDYEHYTQARR